MSLTNDVEIIKKYKQYYKLELIQHEDVNYSYSRKLNIEVMTKKRFDRLVLKSKELKNILKKSKLKKWNLDTTMNSIHPPYFILRFKPKTDAISIVPPIKMVVEEQLPDESFIYERVNLPNREYVFRDGGGINSFMDGTNYEKSQFIKYTNEYVVINRFIEPVMDIQKIYYGFVPVFMEFELDVPFDVFKNLIIHGELECDSLPQIDNNYNRYSGRTYRSSIAEGQEMIDVFRGWIRSYDERRNDNVRQS